MIIFIIVAFLAGLVAGYIGGRMHQIHSESKEAVEQWRNVLTNRLLMAPDCPPECTECMSVDDVSDIIDEIQDQIEEIEDVNADIKTMAYQLIENMNTLLKDQNSLPSSAPNGSESSPTV